MASTAAAQVRGRVVDLRTRAGIAGASVRLRAGALERHAFTGEDGSYQFPVVAAAAYSLSVEHPGYEAAGVRVHVNGEPLFVDLEVEPRPIALAALLVPVHGARAAQAVGASAEDSLLERLAERRMAALRAQAAASALSDLAVSEPREPAPDPGSGQPRALHIWGSSRDRTRVLLDGATVNAPLHLGGVLPPLDPALLARAGVRTGGAPARYDGGTSYIMEYRTRAPDAGSPSGWGEVGMLATRAAVETPVGADAGLLAAGRRINHEVLDVLLDPDFGYDYADGLVRGQVRTGGAGTADALVLATRERVRIPRDLGSDHATWRNFASALSWRPGADERTRVQASFSRGVADLPLLSAPEGHLEATFDRSAVSLERDWSPGALDVNAGIQLEHLRLAQRSQARADSTAPEPGAIVSCTAALPCTARGASTVAAFGDVTAPLGTGLSLRAGLRTGLETRSERVHLLPRLALTWAPADGRSTATLSLGRFSQLGAVTPAGGTAPAILQRLDLATRLATHLELRVQHAGAASAWNAAAFVRRDERDPAAPYGATTLGAELSGLVQLEGNTLSGGYSLLLRGTTPVDSTRRVQHFAFLGASSRLGPLHLSLSSLFGAGLPLTSIVLDGVVRDVEDDAPTPMLGHDDPATERYVSVDAEVSGTWTLRMSGREARITPYLRVINALAGDRAMFYYQEGGQTGLQPLSALPTLPIAGVRWRF